MALKSVNTPLHHIQHAAYRCRDAAQTRWFWEEVLGFELKMAPVFGKDPATGLPYEYMHLFFLMGDGNLIAFFDAPVDANEEMFEPGGGYDVHVAFECDGDEELMAWRNRIKAKGVACGKPVDHGFLRSIYMYDPNGLQVEVTTKTDSYGDTVAEENTKVDAVMEEWTRKTRARKEQIFGAERLDMRADLTKENLNKIIKKMLAVGQER